jgi:hypothetical protein
LHLGWFTDNFFSFRHGARWYPGLRIKIMHTSFFFIQQNLTKRIHRLTRSHLCNDNSRNTGNLDANLDEGMAMSEHSDRTPTHIITNLEAPSDCPTTSRGNKPVWQILIAQVYALQKSPPPSSTNQL